MIKKNLQVVAILFAGMITFSGCQARSQANLRKDKSSTTAIANSPEAQKAMLSVAESLAGQPISEKDLKRISNDLRHNPETQSAVESVTKAVSSGPAAKYCPIDGKRFSVDQTQCSEHNVELKPVED